MADPLYVNTEGVLGFSHLHDAISGSVGELHGAMGDNTQTSHGLIAFPMNSTFGHALDSRGDVLKGAKADGERMSESLKRAASAYGGADEQGAEGVADAAEGIPGHGGPSAGAPGGLGAAVPGGAGAGQMGQVLGQVGQQVGQVAQSIVQPIQGLAQSLGQIPQQLAQSLGGLGGSLGGGLGGGLGSGLGDGTGHLGQVASMDHDAPGDGGHGGHDAGESGHGGGSGHDGLGDEKDHDKNHKKDRDREFDHKADERDGDGVELLADHGTGGADGDASGGVVSGSTASPPPRRPAQTRPQGI